MWFKNLVFYRFTQPFTTDAEALHEQLFGSRFTPCSSQEQTRYGWVPPMGKLGDQLVHASNGHLLLCAKKEEKILPGSVIKEMLAERVEAIETEQSRKVRKKERDELKDTLMMELLPKAFSRHQLTFAYIAPEAGLLVVDASSAKRADELTAFLRKTLGSLPITLPALKQAPAATMTHWVSEQSPLPGGFELGEEAELKDPGENGGVIRCKQQHLLCDEISTHLAAGKQVVKVALDWKETLSFVLGEDLIVRRVKFSDVVQEKAAEMGEADAAAAFDADFTLMTLELGRFLPELLEALGGEDDGAYAPAIAV
ncbi:recombination-associated protein RdgC [Motiliproteus sp. SC1-56]|uniref:recombination-associated protein RdgC n=1 Tax=Motiliproteus sp. SC1-56 TaxID=2799565 RepID=UPI001A909C12|nr:recombination-associated protein RdgC [Motiliproteus sp. SC1-56]